MNQELFTCSICSSGDYEEDNLIVICEVCQNCAHQKCYGSKISTTLPEKEWVCNNCHVFGYEQSLKTECALCSQTGGLMRPTNLLFSSGKQDKSQKSSLIKCFMKREMQAFDEYYNSGSKEPYLQLWYWVHLSCANWILYKDNAWDCKLPPQSVVNTIDFKHDKRFKTQALCCICRSSSSTRKHTGITKPCSFN